MIPFPADLANAIAQRFTNLPPSGYALLANVGQLTPDERFEVASDLTIRRASPAEALEIRTAIDFYHRRSSPNPYEHEICWGSHSDQGKALTITELPAEQWRYHVVEHSGGNLRTHLLVEASYLTPQPLTLGFNAGNGAGMIGFGSDFGLERMLEHSEPDKHFCTLRVGDLERLRDTFVKFVAYTHTPLNLETPLQQFREMLQLPHGSKLRFLALFAILESLLTHAPKPGDPNDSITRQVMNKMALLNNRFATPLLYQESFGSTAPDKVWKKLYSARSALAHGSTPDFSQPLGGSESATSFVMRSVSAVLRQGLEEPQLLVDLREC